MPGGPQEALRGVEWETYGETILNPTAFTFLILMAILLLFLPRRHALIPFIAVALFTTSLQRVVVATLDFDFIRIYQ